MRVMGVTPGGEPTSGPIHVSRDSAVLLLYVYVGIGTSTVVIVADEVLVVAERRA